MNWFLEHAAGLNFWISIAQFALGLAIGFAAKPDLVRKGKSGEWAFGLWTSQWLFFALMYLIVVRYPNQESLLLTLIDIQSLIVLACAATLLLGEPVRIGRTLLIIGISWFCFLLYNFGLDPWNLDHPSSSQLLRWIVPSQTLSVFSLNFIGIVVCLRYRLYGFLFLLIAVGYGACQQVLYSATFLRFKEISQSLADTASWYFTVAILKGLFGGTFYALSFLILPSYSRILSPESPRVPEKIPGTAHKAMTWIISSFILPFAFALLAERFVLWLTN